MSKLIIKNSLIFGPRVIQTVHFEKYSQINFLAGNIVWTLPVPGRGRYFSQDANRNSIFVVRHCRRSLRHVGQRGVRVERVGVGLERERGEKPANGTSAIERNCSDRPFGQLAQAFYVSIVKDWELSCYLKG